MTSGDQRRALRALLTSVALTILTIAGHTAGGGGLPDPIGLVVVSGLAFGLAYAVSAHGMAAARLLAFLLAGQAFLHLVLTLASTHAHGMGAASPDPRAMIAGHVVAAVLAAGVLTRCDALVERWLVLLSVMLGAPIRARVDVPEGTRLSASTIAPASRLRTALLRSASRRGPPAGALLLLA